MTYTASVYRVGTPLQYIPVLHTCGHFELRYTRWTPGAPLAPEDEVAKRRGHLIAGNKCVECDPSRPAIGPYAEPYATLIAAQTAAAEANLADPRQRS